MLHKLGYLKVAVMVKVRVRVGIRVMFHVPLPYRLFSRSSKVYLAGILGH